MLSFITWQHYLAAIVISTVSYYLYVTLRYYQTEIPKLFNRKKQQPGIFTGMQTSPVSVMGVAKPDPGVSVSDTSDLQFTEPTPDLIQNSPVTETDPSLELITEAGNLIEAFKDIDNKPEFLSLLKILIGSYKRFKDDIDLPSTFKRVIEISKEKLLFPVTISDLNNAWT